MVKIKYINNVYAVIEEGLDHIKSFLEYTAVYYQQGRFCKEKMTYKKSIVSKKGRILGGLVPIVKAHCDKAGIGCEVGQINQKYPTFEDKNLPGITLRPDQERLVQAAIKHHRGVLVSGTGTGKSIIIASIINKYPNAKVLLLAHNKSLIEQLYKTLISFNIDAGRLTGVRKELNHRVIVATIQSVKKYTEKADIIIIDEAHHIAKEKSKYAKLLVNSSASIKIGMTATPQTEGEGYFTQCGCLGPVLDEVSFEEAKEKDLMIPVKLRFLRTPLNDEILKIRAYQEFIEKGICKNNRRNSMIIKTVLGYIEQDKSSMIIVTNTDHGKALQKMAQDVHGLTIPFVYGSTPMDEREQIKKDLNKKVIKSVIASVVWIEGVNIPSLNVIMLASGGKKESALLQKIGRGTRNDAGKDEIIIVDFIDMHKHFIMQLANRLCVYSDRGWL